MAVEFTKQAEDLLKAAREARIPDNVKAIAEDGLSKTKKAFETLHSATKEQAQHTETVMTNVQAGNKTLTEKILAHSASNAEATFDAALKIARAPTLPEAARLQAEFMQAHMATTSAQTQELFQLSSKMAATTLEQMQAATTKMFGQFGQFGKTK
jgi:hypothetical protein